ncbi:MAG TPA: ABC transporter permease [Gemmatimonadaceae bacterium]|nr:ABC transporter permease [Gemmatimonadaceae bacterium]
MDRLAQDIRIALRGLRRAPAFTVTAVVILALGIGMAAAMATVFNAVLLRPLPVRDQARVVALRVVDQGGVSLGFRPAELDQLRRESRTLTDIAGFAHWGAQPSVLADGDRSLTFPQAMVTGNFFDALGVRPVLGRLLRPDDDVKGAPKVIVLSYDTWRRVFRGDTTIVGHRITNPMSEWSLTVVGVAPAGLDYPAHVGAWMPIMPYGGALMDVVGRLGPGVTPSTARAEFLSMAERVDSTRSHPLGFAKAEILSLPQEILGDVRPVLAVLTAAVALLLVMACVNVANLLVLRAAARTREIAVRRALGATWSDVARQLLTESVVLAVAGGALGLACADALLRMLLTLAPTQLPRSDVIGLAGAPVSAVLGVTLAAVLVFGVVPSLTAARISDASALQSNTRSGRATRQGRRVRQSLVASQVALALIVLAGAGLLVRSLERLQRQPLGYAAEHLSILELSVPFTRYDTLPKFLSMVEEVYPRLRAVPGVVALTPIVIPPFLGKNIFQSAIEVEGHPRPASGEVPLVPFEAGGPEYFRTFRIPILRGRGFTDADHATAPRVMVISEAVARRFFPGEDPIGKRVKGWGGKDWVTVVGVAGDIRFRVLREATPTVYLPWRQSYTQGFLAVRTVGNLASVLPAMRRVLHEVDPRLDFWRASPMDEYLDGPLAQPRLGALLLAGFSMVALLLSAVGLYGVVSATVREQTRDLGVRIALGATPGRLQREVLARALGVTAAGTAIGLIAALAGSRVLSSQLFEVSPTDPITFASVCVLLMCVGLLAAYMPARRAMRVDPARSLRVE